MRLSMIQKEALAAAYSEDAWSMSDDFFRARGFTMHTIEALGRRGLLRERVFGNGRHWEITDRCVDYMQEHNP
jgi:hypothetical protein